MLAISNLILEVLVGREFDIIHRTMWTTILSFAIAYDTSE